MFVLLCTERGKGSSLSQLLKFGFLIFRSQKGINLFEPENLEACSYSLDLLWLRLPGILVFSH